MTRSTKIVRKGSGACVLRQGVWSGCGTILWNESESFHSDRMDSHVFGPLQLPSQSLNFCQCKLL